jgi:hypothetical protein
MMQIADLRFKIADCGLGRAEGIGKSISNFELRIANFEKRRGQRTEDRGQRTEDRGQIITYNV